MAEIFSSGYFIQGITEDGKRFRPSDWPERRCGVLSSSVPCTGGPNARLQYSRDVRSVMHKNAKCVWVDERLRTIAPMAFDFAMNFAKDNRLIITEGCSLPDAENSE